MNSQKLNRASRQSGFGILQVLIGLAIIVIVSVAAYKMGIVGNAGATQVGGLGDLVTISSNVKSALNGDYSELGGGNGNSEGIKAGFFPDSLVSGTTVHDQWGGALTLSVAAANNAEYTIEFDGVPQDQCVKMGTSMAKGFVSLTVNGTAVSDLSTATTNCTAGSTNAMIWTGT